MTDQTTGVKLAGENVVETEPAYDSDEAIAARHRALRGTDRLRYYPPHQACVALCGYNDNDGKGHQCYLVPNHAGMCVFSSECKAMWIKEVSCGIIEAAAVRPC